MSTEHDPKDLDEYNAKTLANTEVSGFGIEGVTQHFPCPFCASPDWYVVKLIHFGSTSSEPLECNTCGRTSQIVVHARPDATEVSIQQTAGDDPPEFMRGLFPDAR